VSSSAEPRIDLELVRRCLRRRDDAPPEGQRLAAVAAVLRDLGQGAEVLLIRRATHARDPWSGHMAFPGGRHDPTDPDLLHTAVRETREEVGLDLTRDAELLGRLELLPAIARGRAVGLTIAPYVFALERQVPLAKNHEVEEALWAPLSPMLAGTLAATHRYELDGVPMEFPAYDVEGRIVWGLTYRMLESLFSELVAAGAVVPSVRSR
jgi:8-oxo-dGTP pyrophosphatase MutT (NUDIX family)